MTYGCYTLSLNPPAVCNASPDGPHAALWPQRRKTWLGVRLSVMLRLTGSSLSGALLAHLVERFGRGVRSASQLEARCSVRCLAVCPRLPRSMAGQNRPHEYLLQRPFSAYAESLRALRLALSQAGHDRAPQVIQVTSALPEEGRTTLAFSLGAALVQAGKRVLLFELDLRRPSIAARSWANGGAPADRSPSLFSEVRHDERTGVDLILVGRVPDDAASILSSEPLIDAMQRLRRRYDHVVADSAPVLGLSDAKIVARLVDATILAVRWRSTSSAVVRAAIDQLHDISAPLLGAVITQVDADRQPWDG
jgi:polysaccharide biosynthesis transport protein